MMLSVSRPYSVSDMMTEQLVEWNLAEETKVVRENQPSTTLFFHKSGMTWTGD
jgi:hypothetical protein